MLFEIAWICDGCLEADESPATTNCFFCLTLKNTAHYCAENGAVQNHGEVWLL